MLWQVLVYQPEERCHACSILEAVAKHLHSADTKCVTLGRMALLLIRDAQRCTEMHRDAQR